MEEYKPGVEEIRLFEITLSDGYTLPPVHPTVAEMRLSITPDPILRSIAEEVDVSTLPNDDIDILVAKMCFTMYAAGGVGLAAPQVGINQKIIVFDHQWGQEKKLNPSALINPVIVDSWDELVSREGCLSVGSHYHTNIKRAGGVSVDGFDIQGEPVNLTAEGFLAAILQHECDHLNGKLFIDHIGKVRQDMFKRKQINLKKQAKRIVNQAEKQ